MESQVFVVFSNAGCNVHQIEGLYCTEFLQASPKTITTMFVYIVSIIYLCNFSFIFLCWRGGKLLNDFVGFKWLGITREISSTECFYDTTMDQAKVGRGWVVKL